ncbi:uncharacterized protein (TIGR00369 family) [Nocardioides sp. BE266]|uniref:PaaI family thioesterase n=1 Tax=Nocardioides sp. BE266 TaxID=2817725 RepID=UPI00285783C7|nr:hotdog fold thioesterase [Nocardioides sp. BE266]MDR7254270.1 uncharacterized protein (TIGR00369 family) [Nocardioides sp. BE266]
MRVVHDAPGARLGITPPTQDGWRLAADMAVGPHLIGPDGRTAVGGLGVLIDEVLGYAVMAGLGPDAWSISTELWLDVVGALPSDGRLFADGTSLQHGSFAVGGVADAQGRLVASTRQRGRRIDFDPAGAERRPADVPAGPSGDLAALLGVELQRTGARLVVDEQHVNPRGFLHGGVSFAVCELAATAARVAAGSTLATSSIHVVHTRPAPLGSVAEVVVRPTFTARSLQVSEVSMLVDGRLCASARVSAQ